MSQQSTGAPTTTATPASARSTNDNRADAALASTDRAAARTASSSPLQTEHGTTTIADGVVSKIAGLAARDVLGVHALGGGAARAFGALRERIPGGTTNHSQGVRVEVGESQAAVDIELVAEYGVSIADLADAVRGNIISAVEGMTGLQVLEVNIAVSDVHLPEDDEDDEPAREPRVL